MKTSYGWKLLPYLRPYRVRFAWALAQVFQIYSRQQVATSCFASPASFAVQTMLMNGSLPIISVIVLLAGILVILFPLDPVLIVLSMSVVPVLFL
jgi:hypothetical protein